MIQFGETWFICFLDAFHFKKRTESFEERERVACMSKRRNGFDITRDILQACEDGANKTHIISAANLNNKRINRYLEFCVKMKLLSKQSNGGNFVYRMTPEGAHFLKNYFKASPEENGGIN